MQIQKAVELLNMNWRQLKARRPSKKDIRRCVMGKKILILDDNERVAGMISQVLGRHGYDTCLAFDGAEGFEAVHREKPDLIILELQFCGPWGSRFFRMLTEVDAFKRIPLIVKSRGGDTYIPMERATASFLKPFNLLELLDVIDKNIGR